MVRFLHLRLVSLLNLYIPRYHYLYLYRFLDIMPNIHDRIREELLNKERALWTALTSADPAPAVFKLSNPEANFMFPKMEILTLQDEDAFKKALRPPFHRFDGYQFEEVRTIIVDLMAGVVTYKIRAVRGKKEYTATGSTTWSQGSDGEWTIATHTETLL
jgi:hypothetical protein